MSTESEPAAAPDPSIEGTAAERVTGWLAERVPELSPPLRFDVVEGGRSNLTYRVADLADNTFALRRPPLSGVLPSAHDMQREYRIITALGPTDVPVPATIGECTDHDVLGADFYVMDFVDGVVGHSAPVLEESLDLAGRQALGPNAIDALLALHGVDPAAVGLGDLGKGEGYVSRQLSRWTGQVAAMPIDPIPDFLETGERLLGLVPEQQAVTIAHGDFRIGNLIVGPSGEVAAILDWELCTRGDPLADLGWCLAYWGRPDGVGELPMDRPTGAEGFLGAEDALARYAAGSDLDLSDASFYVAFGYWRLAAVLAGVYSRSVGGAYGSGLVQQRGIGPESIARLVQAAQVTLER